MSTAEQLAFSIDSERRGIHVLLWDHQEDLVRALLGVSAALDDLKIYPVFVSGVSGDVRVLAQLMESRIPITVEECSPPHDSDSVADRVWMLFVQQASTQQVGPWLNGWRRPLAQPPGSMLVIRHADFQPFQRHAPDIASFVGPRIHDASTMLSVFSTTTYERLQRTLPSEIRTVLTRLPGTTPEEQSIEKWIEANAPNE